MLEVAKLEAVHHVVIGALRVEVLGARGIGGERSDAVGHSFFYEVVSQVHVVLRSHGHGHVDGTCPVALGDDFQHHEVVLIESVLAFERDDHLVRYGIGGHHHAALLYGFFVDGDIDRVGGYHVHVLVFSAHPVFQDVLQFERFISKLFCGLLGMLAV